MYLGCIPIVTRSAMTDHYQKIGLPLWVVDNYGVLKNYDESGLKEKYLSFQIALDSPALWLRHWEENIRTQSRKLKSIPAEN
jgi:hypothetical protein